MPGRHVRRQSSSPRTARSRSTSSPRRGRAASTALEPGALERRDPRRASASPRCSGALADAPRSSGVNGDLFDDRRTAGRAASCSRTACSTAAAERRALEHRHRRRRHAARRAGRACSAPGRAPASAARSLLNQPPGPNGIALFTPAWGAGDAGVARQRSRPCCPPLAADASERRARRRRSSSIAQRRRRRRSRRAARCSSRAGRPAQRLAEEAPVGHDRHAPPRRSTRAGRRRRRGDRRRPRARPRRQARLPRASSTSRPAQLAAQPAHARVGQRADGRILLVVVDGRRPGYSVGMTNFELAQTLVRLGAVTGAGARRGRLVDDGLRRHAAEPALRPGGERAGLRGPARRLHAASTRRRRRAGALAERRRRRRDARRSRYKRRAARRR